MVRLKMTWIEYLNGMVAKDKTKHGDKIQNSSFFRTFCYKCEQPIRVNKYDLLRSATYGIECNKCNPRHHIKCGNKHHYLIDMDVLCYSINKAYDIELR